MSFSREAALEALTALYINGSTEFGSDFYPALLRADPGEDCLSFDEPLDDAGYSRPHLTAGTTDFNLPAIVTNAYQVTNKIALSWGTAAGSIGTIPYFAMMDRPGTGYAISAVTDAAAGSGAFSVDSSILSTLNVGAILAVIGSTGNDAIYHVRSGSSYSAPTTTINVEEAVADSTVDGTIYVLGRVVDKGAWDAARTVGAGEPMTCSPGNMKLKYKTIF